MQRIERYGVIALVFLLVTIVAVSLWGERKKTDGWFSFLERDSKASRVDELLANASTEDVGGEELDRRGPAASHLPLSDTGYRQVGEPAFQGPSRAPSEYDEFGIEEGNSIVPPEVVPDRPISPKVQPEPEPEPPAADRSPTREYTIRAGDTLSQIAQRELGTKDRWRELLELNPGLDPARLHVGTKIRLTGGATSPSRRASGVEPKVAVQKPDAPSAGSASGGHDYTVRPGDTLSQIAQRELGSARRWRELVELNPGLDPARLLAGTTIRVPGAAPRDTRVASAEPAADKSPAPSSTANRSKVR